MEEKAKRWMSFFYLKEVDLHIQGKTVQIKACHKYIYISDKRDGIYSNCMLCLL